MNPITPANPVKIISELTNAFRSHANPGRAAAQETYMKHKMPFWGLPSATVKQIANGIFKQYPPLNNSDYREILSYLFSHGTRREEWYAGIFMARKFKDFITVSNIDLYMDIVLKSQWWDIVDTTASNLMGPALVQDDLQKWLLQWINHPNFWVRRTALLTQLNYKDKTDFALLKELILHTENETEFFIRKAIGWALRQYSYTNHKAVIGLIDERREHLSNLSIREALKGLKRMGYI